MLNRRDFMISSGIAGATALTGIITAKESLKSKEEERSRELQVDGEVMFIQGSCNLCNNLWTPGMRGFVVKPKVIFKYFQAVIQFLDLEGQFCVCHSNLVRVLDGPLEVDDRVISLLDCCAHPAGVRGSIANYQCPFSLKKRYIPVRYDEFGGFISFASRENLVKIQELS